VQHLRKFDQTLSEGALTSEDFQTIKNVKEDLTEYAEFVVMESEHKPEVTDDDYLVPESALPGTSTYREQTSSRRDPQESDEGPTLVTLHDMLIKIEQTAKQHQFERQTSVTELKTEIQKCLQSIEKIQKWSESPLPPPTTTPHGTQSFISHLQSIYADFIQDVHAFPLCDYLFQYGILHREQYNSIREEHRRQETEANRTLFNFLSRKHYTSEQLEKIKQAFIKTSQGHLLPQ
jgi:hypothetical protein